MKILALSALSPVDAPLYISAAQKFLEPVIIEYPMHNIWFKKMVNSMYRKRNREILMAFKQNNIAGVAVLKHDDTESKICTLRVDVNFQRQGIGKKLVAKSLETLETDYPIISVSDNRQHEFEKLFKYFGFSLESMYFGKYKAGSTEYVYNGVLGKEDLLVEGSYSMCALQMSHHKKNHLWQTSALA